MWQSSPLFHFRDSLEQLIYISRIKTEVVEYYVVHLCCIDANPK
jgi:hypothetical protein